MAARPTVKIMSDKGPYGYVLINVEDFDENKHELWSGESARMDRMLKREERLERAAAASPPPPAHETSANRLDGYSEPNSVSETELGGGVARPKRSVR
jgi:hypothetical protein